MRQTILFVFIGILVSSCSAQPVVEPTVTSTKTTLPTNTPIPPTPTPTIQPTDTPMPTATPDPLIFRDDFEGELADGWEWTNENKRDWSLTHNAGWLEIMAGHGKIRAGSVENMLLRPGPEGNFELETRLNFRPGGDYQFAGLVIFESEANHIVFGRVFDSVSKASGDSYYMLLISEGSPSPLNFSTAAPDLDTIYIRLQYAGGLFTGYVSENGDDWKMIGTQFCETIEPLNIGIVAGWASGSVPQPAQFDYFVINVLD